MVKIFKKPLPVSPSSKPSFTNNKAPSNQSNLSTQYNLIWFAATINNKSKLYTKIQQININLLCDKILTENINLVYYSMFMLGASRVVDYKYKLFVNCLVKFVNELNMDNSIKIDLNLNLQEAK